MRSRRHKLQVSTFPFLAVLLCAMGALLLVLLVMDRRAHSAALARAMQAARRAAEESASETEAQRAELESAREAALAQRQQEHDAEHLRLVSKQTEVEGQVQSIRDQMAQAAERLRAEQDEVAALKQKTDAERAHAAVEEQALIQVRGEETKKVLESEASRQALTRMTADLARLEQTLADLKAAREKEQKTYSVVPYNGKHGDARQPLYVECAGSEVIFHPDHLALADSRSPDEFQAEVARRLQRQKDQLPAAQAAAFSPYLMLLVRPDGVVSYYRLRESLRGLKIDFGYEFIDKDWVLDFPADSQDAPVQPWMAAAKPAPLAPTPNPPGPKLAGVPAGSGQEQPPPPVGLAGQPGLLAVPHKSGMGSNPGGPITADGDGPPLFGPADNGADQAVIHPGHPGVGAPSPSAVSQEVVVTPPGSGKNAAGVSQGATGALGAPVSPGSPHGNASGAPAVAKPTQTDPPPWVPGAPPSKTPTEAGPNSSITKPMSAPPGGKTAVPGDQAGAGGDKPGDDEFLQAPPPPLPKTSRPPAPLRPARLSGDRDWILYVECKQEGVLIYPTQLLVPASALARPSGSNPLFQSLQQLIDRKQATVRTGEAPYRPEVRFLVHPEAGRTYHLAYPTLDTLNAAKTAQYLGPDDDVATIVAH